MVSDTAAEKISPLPPLAPTPQASAFSRGALLAYLLLIVYASLYPFSGWQSMGLPLQTYLLAGFPRYWTGFDVAINILGYIPLGILTVYALHPKIRGAIAIVLAMLFGIVLSGSMEATQTLLANRVASNLDFFTNSLGALIGGVIGSVSSHLVLERSRLRYYRQRWFSAQASRGLIIFALWPLAQIYPQSYLFGNGQMLPILSDWLSMLLEMPIDLGSLLRNGVQLSVEQYWMAEAIITALSMSGALLALLCMLRDKAPRVVLLLALLVAALAVKTLSTALFFTPENAFTWITPGAQGGVLLGLGLLTGFAFLPSSTQRRCAVGLLIAALIVINVAPTNPYFVATLETWVQGKFLNFNGAAQFLSLLWTVAALWFLLHASHRVKRK
ncbi:MAG: VanZ family protein [Herminiimonas sp.]|uniref:VanZ family protein n=1 Tax=Herminiimonas sp. TaxID=1926289 RepID=UPI0027226987|nr:VanZ family protein [Herminiimonas sp.]MDO9421724.1 VanZ family protein [Herminiimonas sp.]MDO9421921.1 VanZ family protein [Herminiimonas sp.]